MQTSSGSVDKEDTKRDPSRLRDRADERTIFLLRVKQERCELSFNQLYRYYAPRLCAFLRQKGASDRISQEVMQDVMARVWEKTHQYDAATANASTWIFTIARNRYIDYVRKEKRSEVDMNDPLLVRDPTPPPDAGLHHSDTSQTLKAAIASLPSAQAEILKLIYLQGMKQQAVAAKLSIPLNTVKSRLRLALEKLRREMEDA